YFFVKYLCYQEQTRAIVTKSRSYYKGTMNIYCDMEELHCGSVECTRQAYLNMTDATVD
uniref:Uncharacterized protein n=1 Tax=Amphimedon queenslandica TaxID=400682 RepID=A0A1X7U6N6_AMPQE